MNKNIQTIINIKNGYLYKKDTVQIKYYKNLNKLLILLWREGFIISFKKKNDISNIYENIKPISVKK